MAKRDTSDLSHSKDASSRSSIRTAAKRSASSRRDALKSGKSEPIVSFSVDELKRADSRTNWKRVDALTDAEIVASTQDDPDWEGVETIDWTKAEIVTIARKKPISIRLDEDVIGFFKQQGSGYQRRINLVLRSYMDATQKLKTLSPKRTKKRV